MKNRSLVAVALLAVLPLSLVACGDDNNDKADTTTTTQKAESTTTAKDSSTGDTTEDTVPAEVGFSDGVEKAKDMLADAKEPCDVWDVNDYLTNVSQPKGADEVKAAVEVTAAMWEKMAETAPESLKAEADVFRQMAAEFPKQAEDAGYDFEKLSQLDLINSESANNAQQKYAEVVGSQCSDQSGGQPSDG